MPRKSPASQSDVPGDNPLFSHPLAMPLAVALLAGVAAAASALTLAGDSWPWLSAGEPVASRPVERGHQLKGLPDRLSNPRAETRAAATNGSARTTPEAPVRTARRSLSSAFDDPLGGTSGRRQTPTGAPLPDASVAKTSEEWPVEPTPADSWPDPSLPEPTDAPRRTQIEPPLPPTVDRSSAEDQLGGPTDAGLEIDAGPLPPVTTEGTLGEGRVDLAEERPSPEDPDYYTPIDELTHDVSAEDGEFPDEYALTDETIEPFGPGQVRRNLLEQPWAPTTFTWKASALCHKPLYFEDVHLERYGHSCGLCLQPAASGARFFLTLPALPYFMGLNPPRECLYTLGYYRPGSCAPYMIDPFPFSIRAGLVEAGVWTGMPFLLP